MTNRHLYGKTFALPGRGHPHSFFRRIEEGFLILGFLALLLLGPVRGDPDSTNTAPTGDTSPMVTPPPDVVKAMESLTAKQGPVPAAVPRKHPPIIVLKLDDLQNQHPNWQKVLDDLKGRGIKGSIGIICNSLEKQEGHPSYFQWIKDAQASGVIEFWFHGFDHAAHTEDGQVYAEFNHRTYEEQKQRFTHSEDLAKQKLGFPLRAFGPPGSGASQMFPGYDEITYRVIEEDPDINVWLYPTALDDAGKKLEAEGKVSILDRVGPVNIEQPTFVPNFLAFVKGYNEFPDRDYFVIQGHPWAWNAARWSDFDKILDFLQQQNAVFMTPSELAASLKQKAESTPAHR